MIEQKSSIWERLKICWYALTKKNYIFFAIGKEPAIWDENGKYKKINKKALKSYTYITYNYKFNTNYGETNLHDFTWGVIEEFAKKAQKGEY